MTTPLRLLILEDQPDDAQLAVLELERAGFAPRWQRVETEHEFAAALHPELELILADYELPHYDALRALARVRAGGVEAPFIFVSATINEDLAETALQEGAADFIIKDRLARLGPAVTRALERRRFQSENRQAGEARRRSEELSRRIHAAAQDLQQVVPCYEHFSTLAHELATTPRQSAAVEAADAPVREYLEAKLAGLINALAELPAPVVPPSPAAGVESDRAAALLSALRETIDVLRQTKHSFKSKALGELREKLESLVEKQS